MKKLVIIDGHSLLYRAYFALIRNPLYNSKGMNTSALYGFLNMFFRIIDDFSPDKLVIVQDKVRGGYRKELYKEYKANRSKTPPELKEQFPIFEKLLKSAGIPVLSHPEYEGDDIIGSLVKKYSDEDDEEIYVITGDRDMFQLLEISESLRIVLTKKGVSNIAVYDDKKFLDEFGITPDKVIDHKALTGDKSDNIPGVRGVGVKTADKLIKKYSDLETLYENIEDLKGALKQKLIEDKELAFLSRKLATIQTDMEIDISDEDICFCPEYTDEFFAMLSDLEFTNFLKRFDVKEIKREKKEIPVDYKLVLNKEQFNKMIDNILEHERICIDTETTSLDIKELKLVGVSISTEEQSGWYIPLRHFYLGVPLQLDTDTVIKSLNKAFFNKTIIGHNLKFDIMVLKKYGLNIKPGFDTSIAHYLIDSEAQSHSLKKLAQRYLGERMITYEELLQGASDLSGVDIERVKDYACADADMTLRLYNLFNDKIEHLGLKKVLNKIEIPLIDVLEKMERIGIKIDKEYLESLSKEFEERSGELKKKMFDISGREFNPDSPKQLSEILFEDLKIPPVKKTKTGYSTDAKVLDILAMQGHEIADIIKKYRLYNKLLSTYIYPLPKLADKDSRVHTSFNQTVARTGRLSSSNPNLQNIPVREEEGRAIRKAFIASEKNSLISFDYSQIELRVLAHLSEDPILIDAFEKGKDVHSITASNIFCKDISEITQGERSTAKMVNFGVVYGMNSYGLAGRLGISVSQAKGFIDTFFERYSGVKDYVNKMVENAKKDSFSHTLFERKRKLPTNKNLLYRLAVNNPVQGSAADIIKLAMIEVDRFLLGGSFDANMLLQIHDELIFEIADNEDHKLFIKKIRDIMENVYKLKVPLIVNYVSGKDWSQLK